MKNQPSHAYADFRGESRLNQQLTTPSWEEVESVLARLRHHEGRIELTGLGGPDNDLDVAVVGKPGHYSVGVMCDEVLLVPRPSGTGLSQQHDEQEEIFGGLYWADTIFTRIEDVVSVVRGILTGDLVLEKFEWFADGEVGVSVADYLELS